MVLAGKNFDRALLEVLDHYQLDGFALVYRPFVRTDGYQVVEETADCNSMVGNPPTNQKRDRLRRSKFSR